MANGQGDNISESRIRKVIMNEVTLIIAICGLFMGILFFITGPDTEMRQGIANVTKDIEVIKENHLVHIQTNLDRQVEINDEQNKRLGQIENNVTKILTILEE